MRRLEIGRDIGREKLDFVFCAIIANLLVIRRQISYFVQLWPTYWFYDAGWSYVSQEITKHII